MNRPSLALFLLLACSCEFQELPIAKKTSEHNALPPAGAQQPEFAKTNGGDDQPTLKGVDERTSRFPELPEKSARQQALIELANLRQRHKATFDTTADALPTIVRFSTNDRTTSFGASPMQLLVSRVGAMVEESRVRPLATHFSLRKWPSMKIVPSQYSITASVEESPDAVLTLRPDEQLEPAIWYALVVDALPEGFEWSTQAPALSTTGARHVTRFMVGEQPVVSSVRVCGGDVYVDFSERMALKNIDDVQLRGSGALGCKLDGELGGSALSARLRCQVKPTNFTVATSARSLSGQSLDVDSLDVKELTLAEFGTTGCRIYRP